MCLPYFSYEFSHKSSHMTAMYNVLIYYLRIPLYCIDIKWTHLHSGAPLWHSAKIESENITKFCNHCFWYALWFSKWYDWGHITKNFPIYEYNCKANSSKWIFYVSKKSISVKSRPKQFSYKVVNFWA